MIKIQYNENTIGLKYYTMKILQDKNTIRLKYKLKTIAHAIT